MHCLTMSPTTLIVPVKETKGHFFVEGLLRPFCHRIQVFSIAHDLFNGHKWSTRRRRVGTASRRDILHIRWRKRGSDRRRNRNWFGSRRSRRDRTERTDFYTESMELRGVLGCQSPYFIFALFALLTSLLIEYLHFHPLYTFATSLSSSA